MNSLVEALSSGTAPWWAVPVSMIAGVLLGVFAVRRGRTTPTTTPSADDPAVRSIYVRFLAATDKAHNSIVAVDGHVLAESNLDQALESPDSNLRALARSIVDLDAMVNELRILAPAPVVDSAVAFFGFVTASTMDGIADADDFRGRYTARKTALVDAIRNSHG